jgi:hypothetical protein
MTTTSLLPDGSDVPRMRNGILEKIDRAERRRTRMHRVVGAGAVAGVLVTGTGAAVAVGRAPQGQINYTAVCYAAANANARHITSLYLPGDLSNPHELPVAQRVELAESMCAATWRVGSFEPNVTPTNGANNTPNRSNYPVPNLTACQLPDGRLGVFPTRAPEQKGLCGSLGLGSPQD